MERSPQTSARDSKGKQGQDRTCPLPKLCAYGLGTKGGEDNDGLPSPMQGRAVQGPVAAVGQTVVGGRCVAGVAGREKQDCGPGRRDKPRAGARAPRERRACHSLLWSALPSFLSLRG